MTYPTSQRQHNEASFRIEASSNFTPALFQPKILFLPFHLYNYCYDLQPMIHRYNTPDRQDRILSNAIRNIAQNNCENDPMQRLPSFYEGKTRLEVNAEIKSKIDKLIESLHRDDLSFTLDKSYLMSYKEEQSEMKSRSSKSSMRAVRATSSRKHLAENLTTINKMLQSEEKSTPIVPDEAAHHQENQNAIISEVEILNEPQNKEHHQVETGRSDKEIPMGEDIENIQLESQQLDQDIEDEQEEQDIAFSQYKEEIAQQSLGMQLYRYLIGYLMVLFVILTANAIFVMNLNYEGSGVSSYMQMNKLSYLGRFIVKLSNANQNDYPITTLSPEDIDYITSSQRKIVTVDIINSLLIVIFLLVWRWRSAAITKNYLKNHPQPTQYALQCVFHSLPKEEEIKNGSPEKKGDENIVKDIQNEVIVHKSQQTVVQNQKITQQIIKDHFRKWGQIEQVQLVRKYSNFMHLVSSFLKLLKKQARIRLKIYSDDKKQAIYQHLQLKYLKLVQFYLSLKAKRLSEEQEEEEYISYFNPDHATIKNTTREIPIKSVFVVFRSISDRDRINALYKHKLFQSSLFQLQMGRKRYHLQVSPCQTKPLNILWQNYHYRQQINRKRFCCQLFIIIFILGMITLGLFLLNVNKLSFSNVTHHHNHLHQDIQTSSLFQLARFLANKSASLSYAEQIDLVRQYCDREGNQILGQLYPEACLNITFQGNNINFILMFFFSLFIFLINLLTSKILRALVLYRRYRTINQKDKFLIIAMTICSLINSALIIVFIRHSVTGPLLAKLIAQILPFRAKNILAGIEIFPQFNRRWHLSIGNQLVSNFLMSLVFMPFSYLLIYWIRKSYRDSRQRKKNILAEKKELDYCLFYALSLKTYLFCMLYSGTLPVLYLFSLLSYACQYIIRKLALKYFLIQPLLLDERANQIVMKVFPVGLLLHIISSAYTIFWSDIFPNFENFKNTVMSQKWLQNVYFGYYIALFVVSLLVISFQQKIARIMDKISTCRKPKTTKCERAHTEQQVQPDKKEEIITKESIQPQIPGLDRVKSKDEVLFSDLLDNKKMLNSYMMEDNPKYHLIACTLDVISHHAEEMLRHKQQRQEAAKRIQNLVRDLQ